MSISFLAPLGALIALAVVLPLAAAHLAERRAARLRASLGLTEPGRRAVLPTLLATVAVFALLGAAAAEPVARLERGSSTRTDAEAFVVFDTSRSMLAAAGPGAETRFERAVRFALELRPMLEDIPAGVVSLTDRPLPHLFPTADVDAFRGVVHHSIGIERPPPSEPGEALATSFESLDSLAKVNFFSAKSVKRLAIVLSDGESLPFDPAALARSLGGEGISLLLVRIGGPAERVWTSQGSPESYRPDPASARPLGLLAAATTGGRVFGEDEVDEVAAAALAYFSRGPTIRAGKEEETVPLGPYVALAAALPLAFLVGRRTR